MKQSERAAQRAAWIIKELDRRYHITSDALFLDLMRAGIEYAAARALETYDEGTRTAAGAYPPEALTDPSNPDSPTWYDMM